MKFQLATLIAIFTTNASAMCYSVYDRDNVLIYESTNSPVPLNSPSLHDAVTKRFPGSSMMIDHRTCEHFELKESQKTGQKESRKKTLWSQSPSSESPRGGVERIVVVPNAEEKVVEPFVAKPSAPMAPPSGLEQSLGSPPQPQLQVETIPVVTQTTIIVPAITQTTIIGQPTQQNQMRLREQQEVEQRRLNEQYLIQQKQKQLQQQDIAQSQQRVQELIQKQAALSQARREACLAQLPSQGSNSLKIKNAGTSGGSMAALLAQRQAAALAACNSIR